MNYLYIIALIFLFSTSFIIPACTTFKIPAQQEPIQPVMEPLLENSIVSLPITLSAEYLSNKLGSIFSGKKSGNVQNQKKIITDALQELLGHEITPPTTKLLNDLYLRYAVQKAWEALQVPIRLNYSLSLFLNPQTVQISPLMTEGDTARIVVELIARPRLVSGDIPQLSPKPLPSFTIVQKITGKGFHIALDSELSFKFISSELTKNLKGKSYSVKDKKIILENIKIYGSGTFVILQVKINGAAKGTIYLSGIPAYDESTGSIYVKNLDYTVETKSILTRAFEWLLHSNLQESLATQARWDVSDKINLIKDRLSDAINYKLNRYVSISGTIYGVRLMAIGLTQSSIKAFFAVDGNAQINVF